jgi:hypothetical protein
MSEQQDPMIYRKMLEVMSEVSAISKDRKNASQGYNFRGIDDVYNMLHDIMAKIGVFCVPRVMSDYTEERTTAKGSVLIYRILKMEFDFIAIDGSKVTSCVIGEGMDSGDKASNKAMSVAQKYCLLQTFLIPTEDAKDPENQSHEVGPKESVRAGENTAKLIKKLKDINVSYDLFQGWLRSLGRLGFEQTMNTLDDQKALKILTSWEPAYNAFSIWVNTEK